MDDSRSLDPDVIKSKQVLAEIESSLARMQDTGYGIGNTRSFSRILEQHMLFIKGLFILICFVFLGFSFGGMILWHHLQLDEQRFIAMKEQVDIMNTRQEFITTWQKQMQEQMIDFHKHEMIKPN